jgi:hypothetical protein
MVDGYQPVPTRHGVASGATFAASFAREISKGTRQIADILFVFFLGPIRHCKL